jgi:predicted deacylase
MSSSLIHQIDWKQFCQKKITDRTFGFSVVDEIIGSDLVAQNWETLGFSFEDRPIRMVKVGSGKIKILLWSQMHGDEPTATAAIFDLLNFFTDASHHQDLINHILSSCTLYFIPVINPD